MCCLYIMTILCLEDFGILSYDDICIQNFIFKKLFIYLINIVVICKNINHQQIQQH